MQVDLNITHQHSGLSEYKIEGVFDTNEKIALTRRNTYNSNELLQAITPQLKKKTHRKESIALSSASTDLTSGMEIQSGHINSGDRMSEEHKKDFFAIMFERWHKSNATLPKTDKDDILNDSPLFNNGKTVRAENQHHPEFTQSSYLRLRSQEEVFAMKNYLKKPAQPQKQEKLNIA